MLSLRQIGTDTARALVVLALVFLSFAHVPLASAASGADVLTASVDLGYCGDAPAGDAHAPCHACRLGAAADIPAPAVLPLRLVVLADVHYGPLPVLHLPAEPRGCASARGPPAA